MKIKLSQLRGIIKEEITRALAEADEKLPSEPVELTPEQLAMAADAEKNREAKVFVEKMYPYNKEEKLKVWTAMREKNPSLPSEEAVASLFQRKHNERIAAAKLEKPFGPDHPKFTFGT